METGHLQLLSFDDCGRLLPAVRSIEQIVRNFHRKCLSFYFLLGITR